MKQGYICVKCRRVVEIYGHCVYSLVQQLAQQAQLCVPCLNVKAEE